MDIDGARQQLREREKSLERITIDPGDTRVAVGADDFSASLYTGDDELFLGQYGLVEMAKFFSVSINTFRRFPQDLKQTTMNRMLEEWSVEEGELGLYTINGQVVAFCRPHHEHIPALTVFDSVVEGTGGDVQEEVRDFQIKPNGFSLKILTDKRVDVQRTGDISHGGISVRHSDTESFRTSLSAFIFRLICMNGLVRSSSVARGSVNAMDEDEASAQVYDWSSELYAELDDHLHAFERLADIPLPEPVQAIEGLGKRHKLSEPVIETVMDAYALETEIPHSLYRLTNALTNCATHGDWESHQQPDKLQGVADYIVTHGDRLCPHCWNVN